MSLKTLKLDQDTTEIFILEFEKEESLGNVMSEIYKNHNAKKSKFQKIPWINWGTWFLSFWREIISNLCSN